MQPALKIGARSDHTIHLARRVCALRATVERLTEATGWEQRIDALAGLADIAAERRRAE